MHKSGPIKFSNNKKTKLGLTANAKESKALWWLLVVLVVLDSSLWFLVVLDLSWWLLVFLGGS